MSVTSGSGTAPAAARPPADAAANVGEAPPLRSVSLRETELPSDSSPKFASPETILSLSLSGSFILQATFSPSLESNFCQARCLIIIGTEGYLKLVMDAIFGRRNFRNEIIWRRTSAHGDARRKLASIHDTVLFYAASEATTTNPVYTKHDPLYVTKFYRHTGHMWAIPPGQHYPVRKHG